MMTSRKFTERGSAINEEGVKNCWGWGWLGK